jgi:hypothetical protein
MSTKIRIHWQDIAVPTKAVKEAGFTIMAYEHFGIGDCTIIEIEEEVKELPEYWYFVDKEFKFSR